jgi:hypothetical protein
LKKKAINKDKKNIVQTKKNLIITNNFSPTINLKTSVININNNNIFSNLRKGAKNKKLKPKQLYRKKPNKRIPKTKNKSIQIDRRIQNRHRQFYIIGIKFCSEGPVSGDFNLQIRFGFDRSRLRDFNQQFHSKFAKKSQRQTKRNDFHHNQHSRNKRRIQ